MATTNYQNWDFQNSFVNQNSSTDAYGQTEGGFVSSESILLCSGPAVLSNTGLSGGAAVGSIMDLIPIGVIQNFNVSQNKNIQQLFEIGSRETILLPGRTFIQSTISRIVFNGDSLMKAMYATYADSPALAGIPNSFLQAGEVSQDMLNEAGYGDFFLNLAAELFSMPMGLGFFLHANNNAVYGGSYFENTFIAAHSLNVTAGQTIVAENISLRTSKIVPLSVVQPAP